MDKIFRPCAKISKDVCVAMSEQKLTLRLCVERFNRRYGREIDSGLLSAINKDFVYRIKNCEFKIVNSRVAKFCEFLGVEPYESEIKFMHFEKEFEKVEKVATDRPELRNQIKSLLLNIANIASV
ncbi:hypothetical protein [Vibrio sp. 11986-1-5]|uniref:hypothetical protein n=1 Tax=Vibrio sp. 11986-1-5 TaxID=2211215 RepID=UPI000D739AE7|nr:hypothetical protein [Vibrio sp. 11986-1-5]PXA69858.1 hypothetical protein DMC15_14280 [Vibrio sp. 11986-1-5]